ncbi:MAG: ATP-dependent Clp protease proteolytic subunit [Gemmatimonadota bacterium]|nr:ATP-dependent Clp protease proteolytic subunit [Gemmatimonadota bacterium]MDH5197640.1 ATP-dependent Clp protease proteolytic subunit [Gemmatimonadota bacterium]
MRHLLAIIAVLACATPVAGQEPVVYRVPVTGTIELGIAPFIKRALSEAEAAGARAVILDINTLGGRVDAALQIIDAIGATTIPVYAFVDPRAISAGALISISTDSVFMTADATLGASTVVDAQGSKVSEKAQSVMRAQFRALAERRGLDPRIGEAMVDETIAIDGVVEEGKLLTLTAGEAERVGYGIEVTGFDDLLARLGIAGAEIVRPSPNWAEGLVRFLSHPIVAPILLSLGVLGLVIEIKTPSFGLAGMVGLASLGAFFGSHLIIGLAGWEEVILLGAGLIALGIEVFVVPGFGIAGVISILCITSAVFMALIGSLPTWADVARASGVLASSLGIIGAAVYLVVRNLPTSDRWRGIFLRTASAADEGYVSGDVRDDLIGRVGMALTDLHPGGTMQLDGERLDVVTEGDFVNRGARVRVVRAEGYRLVVAVVDSPV